MDRPLISVIVPIYMIDRYVGLCIESIITCFLDVDAIRGEENKRKRGLTSHA